MNPKNVISPRTIIFTVIFLLSLWFVYQIQDIILMVFIAFILMSAFHPAVDWLERKHLLPRAFAILVIYLVFWSLLGAIIAGIVPGIVEQSIRLVNILPAALNKIDIFVLNQDAIYNQVIGRLAGLPESLIKLSIGLFGNVVNVLTTIVISFYLLLERRSLSIRLGKLFNHDRSSRIESLINRIESRLGNWIRGELILMLSVGALTYVGLLILGVDSALPLAVLAGFMEIIPNIGPTISAIPAVIVAFAYHPLLAISTVALYFLVQFLENHLLVPKIMQKAVGVNPLVSIIALMIGFQLAGPAGAVLALPAIIIAESFFEQFPPSQILKRLFS